ncbi:MAG: signal peptidase II [Oscillospiraceae bacterium]|nr:signal peptidase II [Oscillospiraceae bacterium]
MSDKSKKSRIIALAATAVLTAADQLIKLIVVRGLLRGNPRTLIANVLALRYVENTGAAFSIFQNRTTLLAVFTGAALAAGILVMAMGMIKSNLLYASFVMIVAGGLGNLIDRVLRGFVIDYIEPLFMNFAVFNFADALVTLGAFAMIAYLLVDIVSSLKKRGGE